MDNSVNQEDDPLKDGDNQKKPAADDALNKSDDTEEIVVNTYAEYEPADIPGTDFATGKDLIPLSKQLVKCENSLASYGLFSDYDRNKIERKVFEMKDTFMKAVKTTSNATLFSDQDEWLPKGSAMEGNLFPALHELSDDQFRNKLLGENPPPDSVSVLDKTLTDFNTKSKIQRYIIQLADIDIMVSPNRIHLTDEKWLIRTKYPNYYSINCNGVKSYEDLSDKAETITVHGDAIEVLCPYKLRDAFEESVKAMCFYNETERSAMVYTPHGLAFQVVKIKLIDDTVMGEFYDLAFAVRCSFWPHSAREWSDRQRVWPDKHDVNQIIEGGVHLVAKSPTPDMEDLLWRYTFAKAEGAISELPLVYWYALRSWSLVKSFLQELNIYNKPNIITSYHIKTLFLYALERLPSDYWINGENTVKTIVSIIDELIACFATHECPHYFTPSVNLFESSLQTHSFEFYRTVAKQLRRERATLISDPLEYFFRGGHDIVEDEEDSEEILETPETPE